MNSGHEIEMNERCDPEQPFAIDGIHRNGEGNDAASASALVGGSKMLPASAVDTTVCGGRTRSYHGTAEIFECRTSCGALQDAQTVKGTEEVRKAAPGSRSVPPMPNRHLK